MAQYRSSESTSIGLDDESWKAISLDDAQSLLRVLSFAGREPRTYSSVSVLPPVDGRSLYVKAH